MNSRCENCYLFSNIYSKLREKPILVIQDDLPRSQFMQPLEVSLVLFSLLKINVFESYLLSFVVFQVLQNRKGRISQF